MVDGVVMWVQQEQEEGTLKEVVTWEEKEVVSKTNWTPEAGVTSSIQMGVAPQQ